MLYQLSHIRMATCSMSRILNRIRSPLPWWRGVDVTQAGADKSN
jgi:hypothetical protein